MKTFNLDWHEESANDTRPTSLWAANTSPESMPYLQYLSQETVVGSAHVQVVSAQGN